MKKSILTIAMAFALALPVAGSATAAPNSTGAINLDGTRLFEGSQTICRMKNGDRLQVEEQFNRWYLAVKMLSGDCENMRGIVYRTRITRNIPDFSGTAGVDAQEVYTAGKWGQVVPVFHTRKQFFASRKNKHTAVPNSVMCDLDVGTKVKFKPFRNWGVGQIEQVLSGRYANSDLCLGWIDRNSIR